LCEKGERSQVGRKSLQLGEQVFPLDTELHHPHQDLPLFEAEFKIKSDLNELSNLVSQFVFQPHVFFVQAVH
jgi:hypothetical protein